MEGRPAWRAGRRVAAPAGRCHPARADGLPRAIRLATDGHIQQIAALGNRPDDRLAGAAQRLADLAHALRERLLGDRDVGPDSRHDLIARDQLAGMGEKMGQNVETLGTQGNVAALVQEGASGAIERPSTEDVTWRHREVPATHLRRHSRCGDP